MLSKRTGQAFKNCCLAIPPSFSLAAGQTKNEGAGERSLTCSIRVSPEKLMRGRPTSVEITVENVSGSGLDLEAIYSFELLRSADESIARNFSARGDSYWSPFDISSGSPLKLKVIEPEMLKQGVVVGRVPKDRLRLSAGEIRGYRVELTKLFWNASVISGWPEKNLFDAVPRGRYWLLLRVRGDKAADSNKVEVTAD